MGWIQSQTCLAPVPLFFPSLQPAPGAPPRSLRHARRRKDVLRLDFSALRTAHQRWPETHPGTLLYQVSAAWAKILQPHQAHWPCSAEVKGGEDPQTIKAPREPPSHCRCPVTHSPSSLGRPEAMAPLSLVSLLRSQMDGLLDGSCRRTLATGVLSLSPV